MVASKLRLVVLVMILGLLVAGAARGNYYDEVMDDSPVAYWRLNESSGTAVYDSAGSHNGTRSGTVTLGQAGALAGDPDTAMGFGGGHVVVPYAADLDGNTFSIECWAKPSSVGGGSWRSPVMYRWVDGSTSGPDCYGYNFYADATHENWEFWIGRGPAAGSFAVVNGPAAQLDKWTHLVGTYDGTTMRFYTDGRYRSSSVQAHGVLTTTSPSTAVPCRATRYWLATTAARPSPPSRHRLPCSASASACSGCGVAGAEAGGPSAGTTRRPALVAGRRHVRPARGACAFRPDAYNEAPTAVPPLGSGGQAPWSCSGGSASCSAGRRRRGRSA